VSFPERFEGQVSPRLGVLWRPLEWLALRSSAGSGFRAPTLNELYRPFQVGTVVTDANQALSAERLFGGEVGVEVTPSEGLVGRLTGFSNRLENPVTNVTLAQPVSGGALRQRQNLGAARIQGIEASFSAHFLKRYTAVVGYTFVDARVIEAGATALAGKHLAQDPQHRGSASVTFDDPRYITATVQMHVVGPQFEDDVNALPMGGFVLVDVSASRQLWHGFELFAAVENLFNRQYLVGRAGIDTVGAPLTARVGLRLRSGRRECQARGLGCSAPRRATHSLLPAWPSNRR
jgi:outer membrane receptor protein involved in Fe transport